MGPIPARTGQPCRRCGAASPLGAYPRSHGATCPGQARVSTERGLSPLARGNPVRCWRCTFGFGPIPARTGQPRYPPATRPRWGAYPRSHGATPSKPPEQLANQGLSPLARGNRFMRSPRRSSSGPIPARTGQPARKQRIPCVPRAYPRSHGATAPTFSLMLSRKGLSPLARGNPEVSIEAGGRIGPIPARTGQPQETPSDPRGPGAYPRSHGATGAGKKKK